MAAALVAGILAGGPAAAEPDRLAGTAAGAPAAQAGERPDATIVACFLLNSMARVAPERARRESLLRAALRQGCLALPAASPFRGARAAGGAAGRADPS